MIARRSRGGFTLLELLLVLAIVATFAGLAAAAFGSGGAGRDLDHSSARLVASLRWARERAVLTGRRHRVRFEADGRSVRVEDEPDPLDVPGSFEPSPGPWGRGEGYAAVLEGRVTVAEVAFDMADDLPPPEDELESGHAYLYFDPTGSTRTARVTLEVEGRMAWVRVEGPSGRARVETEAERSAAADEEEDPAEVWEPEEGQ